MDAPAQHLVAIGIFDGFHLGHQRIAEEVHCLRRDNPALITTAYTFHPHPRSVLSGQPPRLIEPIPVRIWRLRQAGFHHVVLQPFSSEFAQIGAEQFIKEILHDKLQAKVVVVGEDFRFGCQRRGNVIMLQQLSQTYGFELIAMPLFESNQTRVSSTHLRTMLANGELANVQLQLTRPFALFGTVVKGAARGRQLGFPTANLNLWCDLQLPQGVYAGFISHASSETPVPAAINIGLAPTFNSDNTNPLKVEAHGIGWNPPNLYQTSMCVQLIGRLRDEKRFAGIAELKAQIVQDVARAVHVLSQYNPKHFPDYREFLNQTVNPL